MYRFGQAGGLMLPSQKTESFRYYPLPFQCKGNDDIGFQEYFDKQFETESIDPDANPNREEERIIKRTQEISEIGKEFTVSVGRFAAVWKDAGYEFSKTR